MDALQRSVVQTCADAQLAGGRLPPAEITEDVGVWMRGRKLAAIGESKALTDLGATAACDLSWNTRWLFSVLVLNVSMNSFFPQGSPANATSPPMVWRSTAMWISGGSIILLLAVLWVGV